MLAGIQVPPADRAEFRRRLQRLGYFHIEETQDPGARLFLSLGND